MSKTMKIVLAVLGAFILILFLTTLSIFGFIKGSYNSLVSEKVAGQTEQAQINTQLQRRYDLLTELVGATKGALTHEKQVFDDIAKAQTAFRQSQDSGNQQDQFNAGNQLGAALRGYLVVMQQYPTLQALDSVKNLQIDIEGSENRLSVARERYNESVQTYNQHLQIFPANLVANYFHFTPLPFYQEDTNAQKAPNVDLGQ